MKNKKIIVLENQYEVNGEVTSTIEISPYGHRRNAYHVEFVLKDGTRVKISKIKTFKKICRYCGKACTIKPCFILKFELSHKTSCRSCSSLGERNGFYGKRFKDYISPQKYKTWKQHISNAVKGEKNPMYGKTYQAYGIVQRAKSTKGKTFEQIYGVKKAKQIKKKLSRANSGENNAMYGKPSPQGSGNGWSGWYNGHYFRSLHELMFMINHPNIKSAEYIKIPYVHPYKNANRLYMPDFIDGNTIIEIKPSKLVNTPMNNAKYKAARKFCRSRHMKFVVLTEKENPIDYEKIKSLYLCGQIKFLDRYDLKMKQLIEKDK